MNDKKIDIEEYRRTHKRCRTCKFSSNTETFRREDRYWECEIKHRRHLGNVRETVLAGCRCKLYEPIAFADEM